MGKYMSAEYHRQRSKLHYEANKNEYIARKEARRNKHIKFIAEYKTKHGCFSCGETEYACLDMHHVDPTIKEGSLSEMTNYSMERIIKEISKCVVLCANCHRKVHAGLIKL